MRTSSVREVGSTWLDEPRDLAVERAAGQGGEGGARRAADVHAQRIALERMHDEPQRLQVADDEQRLAARRPCWPRSALRSMTVPAIGALSTKRLPLPRALPSAASDCCAARCSASASASSASRRFELALRDDLIAGERAAARLGLARELEPRGARLQLGARAADLGAVELDQRLARLHHVARCGEHLRRCAPASGAADLGVGVLVDAQLAEHRDAVAGGARLGGARRHAQVAQQVAVDAQHRGPGRLVVAALVVFALGRARARPCLRASSSCSCFASQPSATSKSSASVGWVEQDASWLGSFRRGQLRADRVVELGAGARVVGAGVERRALAGEQPFARGEHLEQRDFAGREAPFEQREALVQARADLRAVTARAAPQPPAARRGRRRCAPRAAGRSPRSRRARGRPRRRPSRVRPGCARTAAAAARSYRARCRSRAGRASWT